MHCTVLACFFEDQIEFWLINVFSLELNHISKKHLIFSVSY